jgi:hypothetical protein
MLLLYSQSDAPAPVSPTALFASMKKFATPLLSLSGLSINGGMSSPGSPSSGSGETNTSVGTGNLAYDAVQLVNDAVCVALHFNAMLTSVFPDQVCVCECCASAVWVGGLSGCACCVCCHVFHCACLLCAWFCVSHKISLSLIGSFYSISLSISLSSLSLSALISLIYLPLCLSLSLSLSLCSLSPISLSRTHTQVYFLFASLHRGTADEGDEFRNHLLRVPAQLLAQVQCHQQYHTVNDCPMICQYPLTRMDEQVSGRVSEIFCLCN